MTLTIPSRRRFLLGAGALLAAPSIVRVSSLMPVSVLEPERGYAGTSYFKGQILAHRLPVYWDSAGRGVPMSRASYAAVRWLPYAVTA